MKRRNKRCYIQMVEQIIGKSLPSKSVIHHINGNRDDNRPRNLVLCQDQAYHMLIHLRMRSIEATGKSNYRMCKYCKKWDSLDKLSTIKKQTTYYHSICHNEQQKQVHILRKEKANAQWRIYYQKNREKILTRKKAEREAQKQWTEMTIKL